MKQFFVITLIILGLSSCRQNEADMQGSTLEQTFFSSIVNDEFKLHTFLPASYSPTRTYPVIFLLDGDWYTNDFTREYSELVQSGDVPEAIIIGIGYPNDVILKRFRDYTFSEDTDYDIQTGKAAAFSQFLREELIPKIESDYETDPSNYVLMGHSLGGLNTLYNMFQASSPFRGYVAVSSSIWWNNRTLFGIEEQFFDQSSDLVAKAYIAVGGDEPPSMTILNEEMIERLKARNYPGMSLASEFFQGASHSQVPMIGFKQGIQFVLN